MVYTVTAADASTKTYTAAVTVALNPAKAITAFTVPGQAGGTAIDDIAGTIALTMPFGTNVTALVPTIAHSGVSVNPASGDPQDFTAPVVYTVTAADSSIKAYTVTINLHNLYLIYLPHITAQPNHFIQSLADGPGR